MEKQLSHEEGFRIITEMIGNAKRNLAKDGSFYFLLWGTTVALANFIIYYLINFTDSSRWYMVWLITLPAIPITIIHAKRQSSQSKIYGPIDDLYSQIWIGIFVAMVITLVFMEEINYALNPIFLVYSGIGTYITGRLSRYLPLILGSVALWVGAIITFMVSVEVQFIVAGITIITGYVVPGLMLRRHEK